MALENATVIGQLDDRWPIPDDEFGITDDNLRMIKAVLKNVFPGSGGNGFMTPIIATEAEINTLQGVTNNIQNKFDQIVDLINTKAPNDSPTFTGTPSAATPPSNDSSTRLATTAFAWVLANLKANLDSPGLTGTPTCPTALTTNNTTQLINSQWAKSGNAYTQNANGRLSLPYFICNVNGFKIQWMHLTGLGAATTGSLTWPEAFNAEVYGIFFSDLLTGGGGGTNLTGWTSYTVNGCNYSKATGRSEFFVLAIGR